jgi:hypothetical protein
VAYETGRILLESGFAVQGLLLIDGPDPTEHIPLSSSLVAAALGGDWEGRDSNLRAAIVAEFQRCSKHLRDYIPSNPPARFPPVVFLRSQEPYRDESVSGVPLWLADRSEPTESVRGWEQLLGKSIRILDIPGHHFNPFSPSNVSFDPADRVVHKLTHLSGTTCFGCSF